MNFFAKKEEVYSTSSNDPLNPEIFPDEIIQVLLSRFPFCDLLNATLVSKLWNATIGSSLSFKRRVAIKFNQWNKDPPTAIEKSTRNYEILHVTDFKIESSTLKCFRDKNWRYVTISIAKISSQASFLKLMDCFESVRDLRILCTNIRKLNTNNRLVLPHLENVVLSDVTLDLFELIVANQPSLKSLSLRFIFTDIASPKSVGERVVEFLKVNQNLRDLETNFIVTNELFKKSIAQQVEMNLKSLMLGFDETTPDARLHIEEFLRCQGDSVEQLKLIFDQKFVRKSGNEWGYWEADHVQNARENAKPSEDTLIVFHVWNSMTSLRSLSLRFLQDSADFEINRELTKSLKVNTNVTKLFVQFMNVNICAAVPMELMKLTPNLKSLYVTKLTPAVVRYAAINLKSLRKLMCQSFEGECNREYTDLKSSRSDVNNFIVISEKCALG